MRKYLIGNDDNSNGSSFDVAITSSFNSSSNLTVTSNNILPSTQSILETFQPVERPTKKRKLIDKLVSTNNQKIQKTTSNYASSCVTALEQASSIYDSLSDSQILTYSNFTRPQFELLFLELEPHLTFPHQKGRKSSHS